MDPVADDHAVPAEVIGDDTSVDAAPARSTRPSARPSTAPSVVLIIDPDPVSRRFAEIALGRKGDFRVLAVADGSAAIDLLTTTRVHLILAETDFADINGLQLLHRLTQEGRLRAVPFVFLSADTRAGTKSAAFGAGADDFLCKPCDGEVLSTRIGALIARERRAAADRQPQSYGLAGQLTELSSVNLLALLEHGQRNGTLSVACDDATGSFFLDAGHVVHGVFGNLVGPAALTQLMARQEGHFEFTPDVCPIARERWTISDSADVYMAHPRQVTSKYFAPTSGDEPALWQEATPALAVKGEAVAAAPSSAPDSTAPPVVPAAPAVISAVMPAFAPAFMPDAGSAAQIEHAIQDGFTLGDLMSFTDRDLAHWTTASPVRDRFHVLLAAELAQGVSAMLAIGGAPTEQWVLSSLSGRIGAFGLGFYLRRARLLDIILVDIREPGRLRESLRRVPSVMIVAPPAGDPLAIGVKARIELIDLVSRMSPPAVLVLGNPSLKKAFRIRGAETAIRCLPTPLGEPGADLRTVLTEGIRLCAGATR